MNRQELIEAVKVEAANLRKFATQDELDRLDFDSLDGVFEVDCIYGQLTRSCFSQRAGELINSCAPFVLTSVYEHAEIVPKNIERRWSPIENYIFPKNNLQYKQNLKLISYLKGETDELNLE